VCGIVAHVKDRGVSSVAIRSLAIASSVLTDPREQDEVLEILQKITKESGWGLGRVMAELKKAWGRDEVGPGAGVGAGGGGGVGAGDGGLAAKFFGPGQSPGQNPIAVVRRSQAGQHVPPNQPQQQPRQHVHQEQHHHHNHYRHHQQPQYEHGPQHRPITHSQQIHVPTSQQQQQHHHHMMNNATQPTHSQSQSQTPIVAPSPMKAAVNPLSFADFSLPNHPYQNWYEPPSRATAAAGSFSQPFF